MNMEPGTIWGNRKKDSRPRTINPQTRESMVKELKQSQETKTKIIILNNPYGKHMEYIRKPLTK